MVTYSEHQIGSRLDRKHPILCHELLRARETSLIYSPRQGSNFRAVAPLHAMTTPRSSSSREWYSIIASSVTATAYMSMTVEKEKESQQCVTSRILDALNKYLVLEKTACMPLLLHSP